MSLVYLDVAAALEELLLLKNTGRHLVLALEHIEEFAVESIWQAVYRQEGAAKTWLLTCLMSSLLILWETPPYDFFLIGGFDILLNDHEHPVVVLKWGGGLFPVEHDVWHIFLDPVLQLSDE